MIAIGAILAIASIDYGLAAVALRRDPWRLAGCVVRVAVYAWASLYAFMGAP